MPGLSSEVFRFALPGSDRALYAQLCPLRLPQRAILVLALHAPPFACILQIVSLYRQPVCHLLLGPVVVLRWACQMVKRLPQPRKQHA